MSKARIVVGIDEFEESTRALRWAVNEARLRDAAVEVVYAFSSGANMAVAPVGPGPVPQPVGAEAFDMPAASAEERINEAIREAGAENSPVEIIRNAVAEPDPAHALAEASEDADMLVVGSRNKSGLTSVLLGSVSKKLAGSARCPLVILPPPEE